MTWTTPRVWTTGEVVTAANMNMFISDNLAHLMSAPGGGVDYMLSQAYSTTSTSYVAIDSANLSVTLTAATTRILVFFAGLFVAASGTAGYITVSNGSIDLGQMAYENASSRNVAVIGLFTGLTIGTGYTFVPQWKSTGGTISLSNKGVCFGAMEI